MIFMLHFIGITAENWPAAQRIQTEHRGNYVDDLESKMQALLARH